MTIRATVAMITAPIAALAVSNAPASPGAWTTAKRLSGTLSPVSMSSSTPSS